MLNIIKKELIDAFRDRRTLLLTVFLPMILMSALVFFYEGILSDNKDEVYEVVVNDGYQQTAEQLYKGNDMLIFKEVKDVEDAVINDGAVAGVMFPADFSLESMNETNSTIQIIADKFSGSGAIVISQLELGIVVLGQKLVESKLLEVGVDTSILNSIGIEHIQSVNSNESIMMLSFLIPLILSMALGIGASPIASDLFAGEKERKTMEALLMTPVKRMTLLFGKWIAVTVISTISGIITLVVVVFEITYFAQVLNEGLQFGEKYLSILLSSTAILISYSMFVASLLVIASIFAKTVKEAQSYSTPILVVIILPAMYVVNLGINELSSSHFITPILNLFAIFKEILYGIVNVEHMLMVIGSNVLCSVVSLLIARIFFLKDKWVLAD